MATEDVELQSERHGSRWFHAPPTGEEFAEWFAANVRIDKDMEHAPYVGGIVLIGNQERYKVAIEKPNAETVMLERKRQVYVPYAKVETRVAYFWDLMSTASYEDVVGMIEPVPMQRLNDAGYINYNLPPGFFRIPIGVSGGIVSYIGCSMKVTLWERDSIEWVDLEETVRDGEGNETVRPFYELRGKPVRVIPAGTKMVPVLSRSEEEDPFAVMKAETGAVGRALGMAGMLVIPGSGVATADDMVEAETITAGQTAPELKPPAEAAPGQPTSPEETREELKTQFESLDPEKQAEVEAWAEGRKIDLSEPKDTQLRAIRAALERAAK